MGRKSTFDELMERQLHELLAAAGTDDEDEQERKLRELAATAIDHALVEWALGGAQ